MGVLPSSVTPRMRPCAVVAIDPLIQVSLQLLNTAVNLFTKRNLIELLSNRAMKPLTDPVGLRRLHLSPSVVDVLNRQIDLTPKKWTFPKS